MAAVVVVVAFVVALVGGPSLVGKLSTPAPATEHVAGTQGGS
ncbi:hypothetical protein [Paraburkholderia sp.]